MHTNIELKVDRLNRLYERIIHSRFVDEDLDIEMFKSIIRELKLWGYKFMVSESAPVAGRYFRTDSVTGWIEFIQGNNEIDAYVLL